MAKNNLRWSPEDMKRLGLAEHNGSFVPVKKLVDKNPVKLPENALGFVISEEQSKPNKKIRNAKKIIENGVKFDSRLELYLYQGLTNAGIKFVFQKPIVLQDSFKYRGETVRALRIIFDFWVAEHNILADTKGYQLYDSKIKQKLLKHRLYKYCQRKGISPEPEVVNIKNKKEVDEFINRLKYEHTSAS